MNHQKKIDGDKVIRQNDITKSYYINRRKK